MKIHLIGIGGTGMGALAGLLVSAGHEVRGSDGPLYPPMSQLIAELKIPLYEGYSPANLDWQPDRVVVGNICRKDHPEAVAAQERGLQLTSFPALLSELFLSERHSIVVAGTHGKTTTTSLMAHLLDSAGLEPGFLVGGIFGRKRVSYALGRVPYFVIEGDEYDTAFFDKRPKFVHYQPRSVILTGVEFDHADIYPTMADVERAFAMLIERVDPAGRILVCADWPAALKLCEGAPCAVETYAVGGDTQGLDVHWRGEPRTVRPGIQELTVVRRGEELGRFEIPLSGRHNMSNALAVIGLAYNLGLEQHAIAAGMGSFSGLKRRQEIRGREGGVTVIDDFAHHPTAIQETLAGLRGVHGDGKLWAVFEPRSATSRRNVFQRELAFALARADAALLPPIHQPESIPADERLDISQVIKELREGGTEAWDLPDVEAIIQHLAATCAPGDTVVVMSSGGFDGLIERLLSALRLRS